jgi:hypothetical protein
MGKAVLATELSHNVGGEAGQRLFVAPGYMGDYSYEIYVLSAIDTVLWILRAKAPELSLAHFLK